MGGNAFADLHVPRLSHTEYEQLRDRCISILKERFFKQAISPPEAPSKTDHGDVDILVYGRKRDFHIDELSQAIGAIRHTKVGVTTSFAVPLNQDTSVDGEKISYAQIDVHVCAEGYLEWEYFMGSYGDLTQILGVFNRSVGLTANNKGLHLRIAEIEIYDREKSKVFLTSDPRETMTFLGLDYDHFQRGFTSNEEIYEWCALGKFYPPPKVTKETYNDRQRFRKRAMFTEGMKEYLPQHAARIWNEDRKIWTKEEVLEEALLAFPHARPGYEDALVEHKQRCWEDEILGDVKACIPLENEKSVVEVVRGMKRFVRGVDNGEGVRFSLGDALTEEIGRKPEWIGLIKTKEQRDELVRFMGENWEEVRVRERQRVKDIKTGIVPRPE